MVATASVFAASRADAVAFEVWASTRSDPANGGNGRVYWFDPAGANLGSFNMPPGGVRGGATHLAPNGDVYTWHYEGAFLSRHTSTGGQVDPTDGATHQFVTQGSAGGLEISPDGQYLYAASWGTGVVHIYDTATKLQVGTIVTPTTAAIDVQLSGGFIYVGAYSSNKVYRYTGSGAAWLQDMTFDGDGVVDMPATLEGIAVDGAGNVYSTAFGPGIVAKYTPGSGVSTLINVAADFGLQPIGVEVGPDDKLYVGVYAGFGSNKILRFNLDGTPDATLPTPGVFASGLDYAVQVDFKIIPEPASFALLALGGGLMVLRRRASR
jgi:sugar lactone lactonase YvrE